MKKLLLGLLLATTSFAQTDGSKVLNGSAQPPLPFNILPQPGFENRTTGWNVTSGTFTTTQATANVARGRFSASWIVPASTSSGLLLESDPITIPSGLYGRQCLVSILAQGNASTNGTMVLEAFDETTTYGTKVMPNSANYTKTNSAVFTCPTSGTLRLRVRTTGSSPASPTPVYFDEAYMGDSDSFGNGGLFAVTSTQTVSSAGTVTFGAASRQLIYVTGNGGPVTVSASTPLTAGTADGQEVYLVGRDNTNTVTIGNSGNVALQAASVVLANNDVVGFEWDLANSAWIQIDSTKFSAAAITSGTLAVARGGTNLSSGTSGGILGFTASGVIASSSALTANALVLGGGAGATPSVLGSLGTTSTLLHGNASGAPSFGAVSLTGDVSGALPLLNGGTGTAAASANAAFNALSPLTTKGDILGFSTVNARLPVGTDGFALIADSAQTLGIKWATILTNPMTTGGDLIYGGASGIPTRLANGTSGQYLKSAGGTSAPTWNSFKAVTVQQFLSGSGTYTLPTSPGPLYIRVVMVGPGGGGSGTGSGGTGGNGNDGSAATTFGTTLLSAGPGLGGSFNGGAGGDGGAASLGTGPIGVAVGGAKGGGAANANATTGGDGAASFFGGKGAGGVVSSAGTNAQTNSGSGGGSGGSATGFLAGGGGGAGAYVDAIITSPSATYSYVIGAKGTGHAAGTSGFKGGDGADGQITVYEYFQ